MTITSTGLALPALLGHQLAAHIDRAGTPFGWGPWSLAEGHATTFGLDAGRVRLRLVLDRLAGRRAASCGLI
ncbi:hypothetical protein [Synechococcus sp. EJ6-Ellesmere]|uniref:hypothetical protein n=1 Tax=Synechococcus sp. EJ6-Ellesmere TaxID=2823734 RepID=UPI0020CB8DD6|nr:hypothetical protein [Synechococcus sp. EJ6-Ellesmere]MCP9823896.1 hypothetical protein [Synechococcus sp. EJ6-Ellesmere]